MADEEPRKQSRTGSIPVWFLVTFSLLVLGLTLLVVRIGIGNPQGVAGILGTPTAMPTPTPMPYPSLFQIQAPLSQEAIYQLVNSSKQSGEPLRLSFANLSGADLTGANLTGTNLTGTNLTGAKYNASTQWPEGFDPVAAGAVLVED